MKTISQNPDIYFKQGDSWVISANGDSADKGVTPITLTPTTLPFTLKPYLLSDGIIVKAGEHYLISETTLKEITNSANPHYDIKQNGVVMIKGKGVKIGKTIPIIEVNVSNFTKLGDARDIRNRNAGISSVDYIYETIKIDGVPKGIIDQINYTLIQDIDRPMDTFSVMELNLGDDETVYNIEPLNVATAQVDGKLDNTKLEVFLKDVNARLKILKEDFYMIKGVFLEGKEPATLGKVTITLKAETNPPEETGQIVYKYSTLSGIQTSASQLIADAAAAAQKAADDAKQAIIDLAAKKEADLLAKVKHYKLKPEKNPYLNYGSPFYRPRSTMPIWDTDDKIKSTKTLAIFAGQRSGSIIKTIKENDTFYGYFLRDDYNDSKIWVVMNADKKSIFGYAYATKYDITEEIP
jgi:hypothetical protein